jgi:uncharacterized protein YfcZ (UPF0381/DUF406 family)
MKKCSRCPPNISTKVCSTVDIKTCIDHVDHTKLGEKTCRDHVDRAILKHAAIMWTVKKYMEGNGACV